MRSHRLWRALSERRGEGYVDVIVLVLCAVMVLALAMRVLPVFIQKQQLDTFATELVREAEVSGRVGAETSRRAAVLSEKTGLHPDILWSSHGRIQLNEEVTVTLTMDTNIGLFGEFASFPVTLRAQAAGKSEVYWKGGGGIAETDERDTERQSSLLISHDHRDCSFADYSDVWD